MVDMLFVIRSYFVYYFVGLKYTYYYYYYDTSRIPRRLKFGMEALFNQTRSTS